MLYYKFITKSNISAFDKSPSRHLGANSINLILLVTIESKFNTLYYLDSSKLIKEYKKKFSYS